MIDLHIHTYKSDGQFSPKEIVEMAKENSINIISITDHDNCDGVDEAIEEGKRFGVKVIPGIEFTAFENEEVHILGYNINYKSLILKIYKLVVKIKEKKEEKLIFKTFRKMGFNIKRHELLLNSTTKVLTPTDFDRWLVDHHYEENLKSAFSKYFINGELKNRKSSRMSLKQAIKLIKRLNGIPVLAHPCRLSWKEEEIDNKIKVLKEYGLEGLEVYYPTATDNQIMLYKNIAKKYDLIETLGSDYHGPRIKSNLEIGNGFNNNLTKHQLGIENTRLGE